MPLAELSQNEVGMMTRVIDVMEYGLAAKLARIVDDDVSEAENSLEERS